MATQFPTAKDTLTNPTATDTTAAVSHSSQHTNANDAIEALQDKVGIDSSADTSSLDYKVSNASSVSPGHKHALNDNTDVDTTGVTDGQVFIYEAASGKWKPSDTDAPDASTTVKGVTKMSVAPASATEPIAVGDNDTRVPSQDENDALAGTSGTPSSSNKYVTDADTDGSGSVIRSTVRFGGDGNNGALSISSGATDIDVGGANYYELNYSSISITGTGQLTFSNPASTGTIVVIKSQGNITITSSTAPCIDVSGMGAAGGAGGTGATTGPGAGQNGSDGTTAILIQDDSAHSGGGAGTNGTAAGAAGAVLNNIFRYTRYSYQIPSRNLVVAPGSGGGGGGGSVGNPNSNGGTGGNGGGALIIECGGAWNFTTTLGISVAGDNGGDASDASGDTLNVAAGGGGGGGAGGFALVLYNSLTANTGTINSVGGAGGAGGDAIISSGAGSGGNTQSTGAGGGGAGASGGAGGAGASGGATGTATGTAGSAGAGIRAGGGGGEGAARVYNSAGTSTGGAGGAAGSSENVLVAQNTFFV